MSIITSEIAKDICVRAVKNSMGDDLERARAAFRGLSPKELDSQHGQSGKTRQQILDEYEKDRAERMAALAWLETR